MEIKSMLKVFTCALFFTTSSLTLLAQKDSIGISALEKFKRAPDLNARATSFYVTPNRYSVNSAYDWLETVNVYLDSAKKIQDTSAMLSYQLMQSQLYNDIGDFDKSVALAKEVMAVNDTVNNVLSKRALILLDENYGKLQLYDKQIEAREAMRDRGIIEEVSFYDIYANMGLYRKAMKEYIRTVGTTIPDGDVFAKAKHHNKVGQFLKLDESPSTAINEFKKALGYLEVYVNDISEVKTQKDIFESEFLKAEIEGHIGQCYVKQKEYLEAISLLQNSSDKLKTYVGDTFKGQLVDNALYFAEAHLQLDNNKTAKNTLEGIRAPQTIKQEISLNKLLATYYDKIENYKSAAQYYKKNERITDSLNAIENTVLKQQLVAIVGTSDLDNSRKLIREQKLANERFRNEIQAKDERIFLVYISLVFILLGFAGLVFAYVKSIKNQRLIAEQKHLIENSLREKDSLLKEIHHRVKNNLQMVSSLLSLQTRNTKSKAAIVALEEGKSRVKAMALIHQKLYQNDDLSFIEMQGYIESLINSVQSVYKKGGHNINITIDAEGTELDIDRAIPFGLILNELVSNTFKYAFPDGDENGKIYIHLRKNGDRGYFEYSDNGVGLAGDFDQNTNGSMGLRLINRLVNQLQSKLNIDKSKEGVRFWFDFK
ncbi:Sensory transduction histidine kinase [Croceitalea dokdonensis DOKDO 023]|uniref:histidine kinase n=1 Tax=Croceitalea dokdonensis DOKDO 023 TaxID=1300341 RepID=A0A0P7AHY5_9FLAO|nr:sensor histidine kinase [Croceitalea dokdonensis]KPM33221.1 Sensory transduction histidine kinase [Croceitalea dokdonensis DOKDO 023]